MMRTLWINNGADKCTLVVTCDRCQKDVFRRDYPYLPDEDRRKLAAATLRRKIPFKCRYCKGPKLDDETMKQRAIAQKKRKKELFEQRRKQREQREQREKEKTDE